MIRRLSVPATEEAYIRYASIVGYLRDRNTYFPECTFNQTDYIIHDGYGYYSLFEHEDLGGDDEFLCRVRTTDKDDVSCWFFEWPIEWNALTDVVIPVIISDTVLSVAFESFVKDYS